MTVPDIIHRLRIRANNAAAAGDAYLAADLRLAIAALERLERESLLTRRAPQPAAG